MSTPAGPRFTESLSMHLNGGKAFCEYRYRVLRDGVETGISHVVRYAGRPRVLDVDAFACGDVVFDRLAAGHPPGSLRDWLIAHSDPVVSSKGGEG
jgi:hypothetical protein